MYEKFCLITIGRDKSLFGRIFNFVSLFEYIVQTRNQRPMLLKYRYKYMDIDTQTIALMSIVELNSMLMMIAPNSRARKGGLEEGQLKWEYGIKNLLTISDTLQTGVLVIPKFYWALNSDVLDPRV